MAKSSKGKTISGAIGFYGLEEWWLTTFTSEEQLYIDQKYFPWTNSSRDLIRGHYSTTSKSVVGFLACLASWFINKTDRHLAKKILHKARSLNEAGYGSVNEAHFLFQDIARAYYPDRNNDPHALDVTITACRMQIELAPKAAAYFCKNRKTELLPLHHGYTQLAIILERQKKLQEAVTLCEQARAQGWWGDWQKRIERLEKKQYRQSKPQ